MSERDLGAGRRPLRPGEIVQIKSAPEILATLDAEGKLDGLPFMPEMLAYCGQTVTVYKRADRTCDTIFFDGQRRMHDAVFLTGLRCDGGDHGGCQAGCLIFWKESWLRRPTEERAVAEASGEEFDTTSLFTATRQTDSDSTAERFMCQATEISRASTALPWWEPSQYVRELATGNAKPLELLAALIRWVFVQVQRRLTGGSTVPFVRGRLTKTPKSVLDLRPGELVRVKSKEEIAKTLDRQNRNRGLTFDSEMLRYCGGEYRVLRRVNLIINEKTGELMDLPGDCIVLDNVTCTAEYHRLCRRSIYPYWRELWLARVPETAEITGSSEPKAG